MNMPDEFGTFPFSRFSADEFRHFYAWCAFHRVSDIDLTGGSPVSVSRFGRRARCSLHTLPSSLMMPLIDELFGREVLPRVLSGNPADRTIQINGDASGRYGLKRGERVRLRSHLIQGTSGAEEKAISITMRVIPTAIPDIRTMNIEPDLLAAMVSKNGLGFVCGETGSGKSTLCAALYRYIMDNFPDRKIVTYEDPVEYILGREGDLLPPHQAEIGRDVVSFAAGLRSAVRRNPEIIGVGEIRDNETADAAVQAGNTGHLCLSTMHTKSPGETLSRLLGLFPSIIRDAMAWSVLSLLQFILVQVLVRTNDGGRRAVREYIVIDDELRNKLTRMPHSEWGYHIDEIIRTKKRRIRDYVLEMYIKGEIDRSEAVIFIPPGEMRQ
ncbi:TPA: plasmid transfer ATPase TraJ [Salmonella enterica subsp. enterica serovar Newport]|uniref:Plasmid transfer ATPase TraJ n=2 Tax=Salmonella enterica I TaxID=59201 RepID=A0A635CN82_SALTM|nr:plasmid transfer ATPase TraJ [Salmonella enterica]EAC0266451.1 plasmid transfer ATPase TraJ [Salmonella enterica subsp. enterica serovar Typhimurium]EBQ9648351.1 plasmid transfer ATPase TraJ [Salmonella enterica subsp. enterica serovar Montevideo]EBS3320981.1 plasmid transfer ATPase TraJ [Salmonella enterica subsp. enterica serovar Chester]EBV5178790.1 plasmid transfer ATPase TraJ [Salmonella enterica subsp. enterica serovar Carmel]ECB7316399.1 plasmid transfer ATPase TraJ [Salmonella enter